MLRHIHKQIALMIVVLLVPLLVACGTTAPETPQASPANQAEPSPASQPEPTTEASPSPSAAASPTAAASPSDAAASPSDAVGSPAATDVATDATAEPIGERLDLANLSPDIPDPSEPVTVRFSSWVGDTDTMQQLAEQFQELHPNITIDFQGVPAEEMTDKLLTEVAGGTAPDVAYVDLGAVGDFASRNALVNLDDYINQSVAVELDDYVDAWRESVSYQDSMFGLPIDGETTGLFYRTDMFEAAGIDGPPETWEEFRDAAEKLTNQEQRTYGFILFAPEAAYYWYPWLWQAGGRLLSEDGTEIAFNSEEGKRAAEFYVGLREYAPEDFLNSNSWDGRVAFANGTVGMYVAGAWFAGTLTSEFPDITGKWATAPLPEDQQCATTIAGDALVIFEQSKNKEAAWKWIEFLSAPQNMALWNLGTPEAPGSLLPPRRSLLEDPRAFENNPVLEGFADMMECGVSGYANNENWGQVEEILNEQLGYAIYGEIDAATALDQAAEEGQPRLAE